MTRALVLACAVAACNAFGHFPGPTDDHTPAPTPTTTSYSYDHHAICSMQGYCSITFCSAGEVYQHQMCTIYDWPAMSALDSMDYENMCGTTWQPYNSDGWAGLVGSCSYSDGNAWGTDSNSVAYGDRPAGYGLVQCEPVPECNGASGYDEPIMVVYSTYDGCNATDAADEIGRYCQGGCSMCEYDTVNQCEVC